LLVQVLPVTQRAQSPPQSMSVSLPSFSPLLQTALAGTHLPPRQALLVQ